MALAYYALTGQAPRTLVGFGGLAPHQRDPAALIQKFDRAQHAVAAQAFFEQGFARRPEERFQSIDEAMACWRRVVPPPPLSKDAFKVR